MKHLLKESGEKKKQDVEVKVCQLKQGRPPLLGENLDRQVISYIKEVHEKKLIVTVAVTIDVLQPRAWHFGRHFLREKIHANSAVKTFNQPIRRNCTRKLIIVGIKHASRKKYSTYLGSSKKFHSRTILQYNAPYLLPSLFERFTVKYCKLRGPCPKLQEVYS